MRARRDKSWRDSLLLVGLLWLKACGGQTSDTEHAGGERMDSGVEDANAFSPDADADGAASAEDADPDVRSHEECVSLVCASDPCLGGGCCPDQTGNRPMLEVDYFTCTFQVRQDDFRCPAALELVGFLVNGEYATFVTSEEDCVSLDSRPGIVTSISSTAADFESGAVFWMCQANCDGPESPEVQAVLGCEGLGFTCD